MHTKFNPNQSTPETIKRTFTGRKQILETILDNITDNVSRTHNQHILLTGPRGIGKTHLLRMISIQLEEDLSLSKKWLVLQLAEEEYHGIANLRDFFERTLQAFQDRVDDPQPLPAELNKSEIKDSIIETLEKWKTSTDDDQALDDYLQYWKSFCQREERKLLLLADNIDQIIASHSWENIEEQKLRKLLMNEDWLMLIGTTPTYFQALVDPNQPLYQFFRTIPLAPLSDVEELELLKKLAENQGDPAKLITRLSSDPEIIGRVRAINHLTGGNPRLTVMLYEIISRESIADVKDLLMNLLDELTPYYKSRIDGLSPQQQKIIDAMARLEWDESLKKWARKNGGRVLIQALKKTSYGVMATPSALANITRLPQNQVNTILRRLDSLGYVRKAGTSRLRKQEDSLKSRRKDARLTIYELAEPLFRIYHQYRYSRRWQRQFQVFITFLKIWFTEKKLREIGQNTMRKFEETLQAGKYKEAHRILEDIDYIAAASTGEDRIEIFDETIQKLLDAGQFDKSKELLEKALSENQQKQDLNEISKNLYGLGFVIYNMALKTDGEQATRFFQESIEKYQKATEIKPDMHEAYNNWGAALSALAQRSEGEQMTRLFQESFEKYQKAIEIKPFMYVSYNNFAVALIGYYEETGDRKFLDLSLEKVCKAMDLAPDDALTESLFIRITLEKSKLAIPENNWGLAENSFKEAVSKFHLARKDLLFEVLMGYFESWLSPSLQPLFQSMLKLLEKNERKDEIALIQPFIWANLYWQQDRDPEVLERIPQEMRTIVAEIVQKGEERDKEDTGLDSHS